MSMRDNQPQRLGYAETLIASALLDTLWAIKHTSLGDDKQFQELSNTAFSLMFRLARLGWTEEDILKLTWEVRD